MNRCKRIRARLLLAACAAVAGLSLSFSPAALAQGIQRSAPKDVVLGQLVVTARKSVV